MANCADCRVSGPNFEKKPAAFLYVAWHDIIRQFFYNSRCRVASRLNECYNWLNCKAKQTSIVLHHVTQITKVRVLKGGHFDDRFFKSRLSGQAAVWCITTKLSRPILTVTHAIRANYAHDSCFFSPQTSLRFLSTTNGIMYPSTAKRLCDFDLWTVT